MLKIGLVGYGFMGHMHAQCYAATGDAKVVAVADVEAEKRQEAQEKLGAEAYASIEDMLANADIDAVDICTPTYLHEEHVAAAAKAGKDLMCEKPMALSVESCDRMIAAIKQAGVKSMFGHVIRFWPEYKVLKDILDTGRYGKIEWISARRLSPPATWAWQGWLADPKRSGGGILDLHIHDVDFLNYLLGLPKTVDAKGALGPCCGIDSAMAIGSGYASGASSYAEASLYLAPGYPFNMALLVACEKATMKFDLGASPSLIIYPIEGDAIVPEIPTPNVGVSTETSGNIGSLGGYFYEIQYFVDCLKAGKQPEIVTPESSRDAVRVCLAEVKSVETGCPVEV